MKRLLLLALFALLCIARSAPPPVARDRTLILTNYDEDVEVVTDDTKDADEDDENTSPTTTTTLRSTYVFPTRNRFTSTPRRPWLTARTTTTDENEIDFNNIGTDEYENGYSYFRNIREFFKKLFGDVNKFFQKITGVDIVKAIKQFFNRNIDE